MSAFIDLFHDSMCALSVMRRGRFTLHQTGLAQGLLEVAGEKLDAAVAMHKGSGRRASMAYGRDERTAGQRGCLFPSQRPAQQAAGVAVHHRGEIAQVPATLRYVTSVTQT